MLALSGKMSRNCLPSGFHSLRHGSSRQWRNDRMTTMRRRTTVSVCCAPTMNEALFSGMNSINPHQNAEQWVSLLPTEAERDDMTYPRPSAGAWDTFL